jgi:hypothetical protein
LVGEQPYEDRSFAAVAGQTYRTANRTASVDRTEHFRYFSGKMTRAANKGDDLMADLAERQSSRRGEASNA